MHRILSFLFSAVSLASLAQLNREVETGIDTVARARGIRKQVENSWWIGKTEFRNTLDRTRLFDSLGYLVEVDADYAFNIGFTKYPGKISNKTRFFYDKEGKLMKEDVEGSSLPAPVKDTITKLVSRDWQMINHREVLKQEVFITKSDDENQEITYDYYYDLLGRKDRVACVVSDSNKVQVTYTLTQFYYKDGLLSQVIETTNGRNTASTTYDYTYFEKSAE